MTDFELLGSRDFKCYLSNAIGSNVFDINLGLGAPFLIFSAARGKPVSLLRPEEWVRI